MKSSVSSSFPHTMFSAFLFAPLCREKNGMQLSVVSALTRLGIDPWREAYRLAGLPDAAAAAALAATITRMPGAPVANAAEIAQHLVSLLPKTGQAQSLAADAPDGPRSRMGAALWLLYLAVAVAATLSFWT